jgi:hypothetical protein
MSQDVFSKVSKAMNKILVTLRSNFKKEVSSAQLCVIRPYTDEEQITRNFPKNSRKIETPVQSGNGGVPPKLKQLVSDIVKWAKRERDPAFNDNFLHCRIAGLVSLLPSTCRQCN